MTSELELCPKCLKGHLRPTPESAREVDPFRQTGSLRILVCDFCGMRNESFLSLSPGEKHWHGATSTIAMSHTAIQEQLDGRAADWLEKVSDEQYSSGMTARN